MFTGAELAEYLGRRAVAILCGVVLACCFVACGTGAAVTAIVVAYKHKAPEPVAIPAPPPPIEPSGLPEVPLYSRVIFEKLVVGKTPKEVVFALGRPTAMNGDGDTNSSAFEGSMTFSNACVLVYDDATNHVGHYVYIHFKSGKVTHVQY